MSRFEYYGADSYYHLDFTNPAGRSARRAARNNNRRSLPCPTCGHKNRLTPADRAAGYQCDACANRQEGGYDG